MIEERAVILSLDTSSIAAGQTLATLEIERKTACGLCGKTRGCGNSLWGKLFAHKRNAFKASNGIDAKVGQAVIVGINEQALLKSAFFLYIVPLVTMFLASMLMLKVLNTDAGAMIGAVIGLALGLAWVKGFSAGRQYFVMHQPVILRMALPEENEIKFVK